MNKSINASRHKDDTPLVGDIRELVSFKLARLTTLNDRVAQRLISDRFGLRLRDFRTLATIAYLNRPNLVVLARESFLDHAQVSRIVASLVSRGLVERVGTVDRGGELQLTREGREIMREGLEFASFHNGRLTAEMPTAEVEALNGLIDELIEAAKRRYAEVDGEISDLARSYETEKIPLAGERRSRGS